MDLRPLGALPNVEFCEEQQTMWSLAGDRNAYWCLMEGLWFSSWIQALPVGSPRFKRWHLHLEQHVQIPFQCLSDMAFGNAPDLPVVKITRIFHHWLLEASAPALLFPFFLVITYDNLAHFPPSDTGISLCFFLLFWLSSIVPNKLC